MTNEWNCSKGIDNLLRGMNSSSAASVFLWQLRADLQDEKIGKDLGTNMVLTEVSLMLKSMKYEVSILQSNTMVKEIDYLVLWEQ
ncbi:hypothetical protein L3X38_017215 [Prunus dulcis]|uniref:Uncharacterized protein n=1 Tax=Prunus dulcis TaxID=3755 RepID=A0AAD4Z9X5_PRUDU|nr:hypothetical protein L3X38_017211 [Prunus dulcis]KAI5337944.1 hypothetical protein L3X38_017215 [Prunus dulcis]